MSDIRLQFIRQVEEAVIVLPPEHRDYMVYTITKILSQYEVTERCTDLVTVDPTNERIRKRYFACLMIDGKSEKTIYQYQRTLARLEDALGKPYTDMGVYDIRYFLACEKDRGLSNVSVENLRANLSAFFQWMSVEEIIPKNPLPALKPIKCKQEVKKAFADTEIDALRSSCKGLKERALVEFLLSSGVRVEECSMMDVADIDFVNLSVHVRHGKGNKERMTYITSVAAMHLERYLKGRDGEALFLNRNHQRIEPGGVRFILNQLADRAGVENVHPHRFRRTFATGLAARGMDIQEIQKLLGHSSIETTLRYVCVDEEKVKASYKRYA